MDLPYPVLVVDDEASFRRLTREALVQFEYRVEEAAGVAEARELLRTRPYALILCDFEMPESNGLDLLQYVARVHPDLPFIMITAHDEVPLAREAISTGALDFISKPFSIPQLVRLLEQNWARRERDRRHAAELRNDLLKGTIRALVAAIDAKDPHTALHSERVAALALRLGKAVPLPEARLRVLEFAALLHDVGKIAVPSQILLKEGKLDEREWEVVKRHPVRSAEIAQQVPALGEVATLVRHHHERIDGRGYPDGLAGEAIPFLARLLAVVDAYEAMTSDRAYRAALTPEVARGLIREGLGAQFDRGLGEMFLSLADLD